MKDQMFFTTSIRKNSLRFILLPAVLLIWSLSGCAGSSEKSIGNSVFGGARLVAIGDGLCQDTKTGKMWQTGRSGKIDSLDEAKGYASALNAGGYEDWRLPTVAELYNLYMTFDLHQNSTCSLEVEGTYWSDEQDLEGRVGAWELDDNCDPERQYIPKRKGYVRAIRD